MTRSPTSRECSVLGDGYRCWSRKTEIWSGLELGGRAGSRSAGRTKLADLRHTAADSGLSTRSSLIFECIGVLAGTDPSGLMQREASSTVRRTRLSIALQPSDVRLWHIIRLCSPTQVLAACGCHGLSRRHPCRCRCLLRRARKASLSLASHGPNSVLAKPHKPQPAHKHLRQ
jgi:hypothetical protein